MEKKVNVKITADPSAGISGLQRFNDKVNETAKGTTAMSRTMKAGWVGAASAVSLLAVGLAKAEDAAKNQAIESSFRLMADASRISADAMLANMARATRGTIDATQLMQKSVKLMLDGYDEKQIVRFSENAITASRYMGKSVSEAFNQVADALSGKMPRAMLTAGAITREQIALVNRAVSAGADEMALYELAMANLELKALQLQGTTDNATIAQQKFRAQIKDTGDTIGGAFLAALQKAYGVMQWLAAGVLTAAGAVPFLLGQMMRFNAWVIEKTGDSKGAASVRQQADDVLQVSRDMFAAAQDLTGKAAGNISGVTVAEEKATDASIAAARKKVAAQEEYLKKIAEEKKALADAERAARERERALNETYSQRRKLLQAIADAEETMHKAVISGTEATLRSLEKIADNKVEFYSDIQGFEEQALALRLEQIEKERLAYIEMYQDVAAANAWANQRQLAAIEGKIDAEQAWAGTVIGNFDRVLDAALSTYDQDSREFKRLGEFKRAIIIAQQAMEAAKQIKILQGIAAQSTATVAAAAVENTANTTKAITGAVASVTSAGSGDPYTGIARVAAMIALMASVLSVIGVAFSPGGSSGAGGSVPLPAGGNTTVLGAEYGAGSASIAKSLEIMRDTYDLEDIKLTKIHNELRDLNYNITGLVSSILRTGGWSSMTGSELTLLNYRTASSGLIGGVSGAGFALDPILGSSLALMGLVNKGMSYEQQGQLLSKMIGLGSGDPFTALTHGLLDKIFGGKLGSNIGNFLGSVFGGKTTIGSYAGGLAVGGGSIADILASGVSTRQYTDWMRTVKGGWFHSDKTTSWREYQAVDSEISGLFSRVFQGMGETLVGMAEALGADIDAVLAYQFKNIELNLMGKSGEQIEKAITQALSNAGDNAAKALFGDLIGRYQQINEGLLETAVRLVTDKESIMSILALTNQTFKGTTSALIAFSEELIRVAGGLDELTDAFKSYYDAFFSDVEKQADIRQALMGVLGGFGFALPTTRGGYRELVESLDLTTEAGLEAYSALMKLADSADKYYSYIEDARSKIKETDFATRAEYERAVRGYAFGGSFSGGWRVVGERGPELEYTGPSQIYSTNNTRKTLGTDELIAEVKQLRAEVGETNFSMASTSLKLAKLLDKWDGEGIPAERT